MEKNPSILNLDLKTLLTYVIPGIIGLPIWVFIICDNSQWVANNLKDNQGILITLLFLAALFLGVIFDNIASSIERKFLDKSNVKKIEREEKITFDRAKEKYDEIWSEFLQLRYSEQEGVPVGHRYLRNILIRMKFELCSMIGILSSFVGLLVLGGIKGYTDYLFWVLVIVCPLILMYYLAKEAELSSEILAETRELLVGKFLPEKEKISKL